MVTSRVAAVKAFGVKVRHPARRELRRGIAIAPKSNAVE
jgi:hypothetical protein